MSAVASVDSFNNRFVVCPVGKNNVIHRRFNEV